MKKKYFIVLAVIIIIVIGIIFMIYKISDKYKQPKDSVSKQSVPTQSSHIVRLDESKTRELKKYLKVSNQKLPNNEFQVLAHHLYLLKDSTKYLEYIRSKGIGFCYNLLDKAKFISPQNGWQSPSFAYFPVYISKSDVINYNGEPLRKLYERGSYNTKYYPNMCEELIEAISGFGPQKPSKMEYFRYFLDTMETNDQYWCYHFSSIDTVSYKNNPVRGKGRIWIDKGSVKINKIKSKKIEYCSANHGVVRNFGVLPTYNISFSINYEEFEKGIFFKTIEMDIRYVRSEGVGRYPRRPRAKKHRLTERNILHIDKLFQSKMPLDIGFPPEKVNYNKQVWSDDTIVKPYNYEQIRKDLSNYKPVIKQFRENNGDIFEKRGYTYSQKEEEKYKRLKSLYDSLSVLQK